MPGSAHQQIQAANPLPVYPPWRDPGVCWLCPLPWGNVLQMTCVGKARKTARIRNRYNQVPHLSQDIKWESNKSQSQTRAKGSALSLQVTTRQQWTDTNTHINQITGKANRTLGLIYMFYWYSKSFKAWPYLQYWCVVLEKRVSGIYLHLL